MKKVEQNKMLKKEALLESAYELFTTLGFHKTSISDIASGAGVAKGTFYLYFRDKSAIRNELIAQKSSRLFLHAMNRLERDADLSRSAVSDKIIFIVDDIITSVSKDTELLRFISKNLSWGLFKSVLTMPSDGAEVDFLQVYQQMIADSSRTFRNPEIMIFLIIELVGSTCYNAVLYRQPVDIDTLKPHLYSAIRLIIEDHYSD